MHLMRQNSAVWIISETTFGVDPLIIDNEKKNTENYFAERYPSIKPLLHSAVNMHYTPFKEALFFLVDRKKRCV